MAGDENREEFRSEEPVLERRETYPEAPTRLTAGGAAMGPHHYIHCSELTNDKACTLVMAGYEDELESAVAHHLVSRHLRHDTDELRREIRQAMKKVPPGFFS